MTATTSERPRSTGTPEVESAGAWCAPITGFRGVAALLVVAGHTCMAMRIFPFTAVIHVIGLIVPTFFVISAYALYRPFLEADVQGTEAPSARAFWWKRFLRIYPLYAFALTLYLVLLPGVRPPGGAIADYAKLYGFLQVYDKDLAVFSGIPAAWFLCDEVAFYLFLPVIAIAAGSIARRGGREPKARRRLQSHVTVAIAMIVIGMVSRTWLVLAKVPAATSLPVSNLDYYGLGILLAAASVGERRGVAMPRSVEWLRHRPLVAIASLGAGIAAMCVIARNPGASFSSHEDIWRYGLYTVMVVPLMVVMVLGRQDRSYNRWLGSKRWTFLAVLSLHAYLWHQLLLGGFDRYVHEMNDVHIGPRVVTGLLIVAAAIVSTVIWSAAWRALLDQPYKRWKAAYPRPADAPPRPTWFRPVALGVTVALLAAGTAGALRFGGSPLVATGGVGLVTVTDAQPGDQLVVRQHGKVVDRGTADDQGAFVARDLDAGGASVEQRRDGQTIVTRHPRVRTPGDLPPRSLYTGQHLRRGLDEITTRDGTRLSAYIQLPGPADEGPYPTVVEYTAYQAGDKDVQQPATAAARAMGYATVSVNVRGTGCSGGAFDLFSSAQATDGYDVVQTVAAQPWVRDGKVGLVGFSYGGLAALQVASTKPSGLSSVLALSVYGEAWQAFHPGGLANAGFPVGWMRDLQHDAEPAGAPWIQARIQGGDTACARNQELHHQQADLPGRFLGDVPDDSRFDTRSPATWATHIAVPVFVAGQFQDTTLGADLAEHLDAFGGTRFKAVLSNGTHGDGVSPQVLDRMHTFLGLYVRRQVPGPFDAVGLVSKIQPDFDHAELPIGPAQPFQAAAGTPIDQAIRSYEAGPKIEVLWESGAAKPKGAAGSRWSTTTDAWPPSGVAPATWHLRTDGVLSATPGSSSADAAEFATDPDESTKPYSTEGSTIVSNTFVGWNQPDAEVNAAWISPALAKDTAMAGTASVDLWIRADKRDVDLQVVLLDVSDRGDETFVQSGWQRASQRKSTAASGVLRPVNDFTPKAAEDLVPGQWTKVRVRLSSFAHVFRAGSKIRLLVGTPGNDQVQWAFGPPPDGAALVDIGQGGVRDSQLVLPVWDQVPGPGAAACGVLRGQPCRPYKPFANHEVAP